jgi:hypothetical protein
VIQTTLPHSRHAGFLNKTCPNPKGIPEDWSVGQVSYPRRGKKKKIKTDISDE